MADFKELYDYNPYLKEFDSEVVSCTQKDGHFEVILKETAFYPEGGGQPCDIGTLNGIAVMDVQQKKEGIVHTCAAGFEEGEAVHGVIDWNRRFDLMQNHSGEHIVSGLIHRAFGYENVGFHMGEVIQIDFDGPLSDEQLEEIERKANEIVMKNEKIIALFPDEEELKTIDYRSKKELTGVVRIIDIPGADTCACCGTHVAYTGEIGLIKLLSRQKHKKGVRVEMVSGMRAFLYVQKAMKENHAVSVALSAKELETSSAVDALLKASSLKDARIREVSEILLQAKQKEYADGSHLILDFNEPLDRNVLVRHANALADKADIACVFSGSGTSWNYMILSRNIDLRQYTKQINSELNGRGGGPKEMIQGNLQASEEQICEALGRIFAM